jgi:hypothetical protein
MQYAFPMRKIVAGRFPVGLSVGTGMVNTNLYPGVTLRMLYHPARRRH